MIDKTMISDFFDNSLRIEQLIHIGTQMLDESLPSAVKDAFNSDVEEIAEALGVDADELADVVDSDLSWGMRVRFRRQGFLAQFATPVPRDFSEDGSCYSFSWGYYATKWIYAESLEDCCKAGLAWNAAYIEEQKKEQLGISTEEGQAQ